jgi:predicted nucleic acid-binding protein
MKNLIYIIPLSLFLVACSSTKKPEALDTVQTEALGNQRLVSNFKRQGVKIEWNCRWGTGWSNWSCVKGDLKAIEVTAYANSNGNSDINRETAFRVGAAKAKAKLRNFINEDVSSTTTINTLTKNIEKANDRIKQRIAGEEVEMTDEEAAKETNWAVRENSNDIARSVTETIRINSAGILKGVYVVNEKVVDRQTVEVTIRWDRDSEKANSYLKKVFR